MVLAKPLLNVHFLLIHHLGGASFLVEELVDKEHLVFLLLTHLALPVHLLDPLASVVDFLLDGHAFVEGGLTL